MGKNTSYYEGKASISAVGSSSLSALSPVPRKTGGIAHDRQNSTFAKVLLVMWESLQKSEGLERKQKVEMIFLRTCNALSLSDISFLQPSMIPAGTSPLHRFVFGWNMPLYWIPNMNGDYFQNCTELIDVSDTITAGYWETGHRIAEQSQIGFG
ncbi:hypothetical protein CDAR_542621 [Caerostris darwini]|uniref:Uncharacterized protein n=1 Tax=Caerostris darwini TaxID=1538125 RepID=A0AAV4S7A5_9ARAC|nr:hypothetical protein CDAR_542621 [Caerostris darwini]